MQKNLELVVDVFFGDTSMVVVDVLFFMLLIF